MNVIEINGKSYPVRFGFNQIADMEKALGKPIGEALQDGSVANMIVLFQFALRRDNPKITTKQAGDLMTDYTEQGGDFQELFEMIGEEVTNLMGDGTPSTSSEDE